MPKEPPRPRVSTAQATEPLNPERLAKALRHLARIAVEYERQRGRFVDEAWNDLEVGFSSPRVPRAERPLLDKHVWTLLNREEHLTRVVRAILTDEEDWRELRRDALVFARVDELVEIRKEWTQTPPSDLAFRLLAFDLSRWFDRLPSAVELDVFRTCMTAPQKEAKEVLAKRARADADTNREIVLAGVGLLINRSLSHLEKMDRTQRTSQPGSARLATAEDIDAFVRQQPPDPTIVGRYVLEALGLPRDILAMVDRIGLPFIRSFQQQFVRATRTVTPREGESLLVAARAFPSRVRLRLLEDHPIVLRVMGAALPSWIVDYARRLSDEVEGGTIDPISWYFSDMDAAFAHFGVTPAQVFGVPRRSSLLFGPVAAATKIPARSGPV